MKNFMTKEITWASVIILILCGCNKENKGPLSDYDKVVIEKTKNTKGEASDETKVILKKEVDRLEKMGFKDKAPKKGESIPNAEFLKPSGEKVQLQNLYKEQIVVLNFCRGVWSSYCRIHMQFSKDYDQKLKEYNVKTVYVVPDFYSGIEKFCDGY